MMRRMPSAFAGALSGSATETFAGQVVHTATGDHFVGSDTLVYRVDFADGSYLVASQREPLTFSGIPLNDQDVFGGTLLEMGTLYDSAGNVIGHEMFHARFRTTVVDGAVVVEFDEGFLTCR
jgi:hypothetical protein